MRELTLDELRQIVAGLALLDDWLVQEGQGGSHRRRECLSAWSIANGEIDRRCQAS